MRYWREPLDSDRIAPTQGEVHIFDDRCKGCEFCVEYCPRDVLVMSGRFNRKGYHPPRVERPEACVACGLCEMICPEFAIFCSQLSPGVSAEGAPGGEVRS